MKPEPLNWGKFPGLQFLGMLDTTIYYAMKLVLTQFNYFVVDKEIKNMK
jgi:hypothetical protein